MTERKFAVKNSAGEKLVGVEVLPEENPTTPLPVVILCHGFAWKKEEDGIFTGIAERLAGLGYAVYYFDFSGCGESEGDYEQTSLTKLVNDLKSIWDEVSNYPYINSEHLSLVGQSFGTNVVVASQLPVERIALCGAFSDPHDLLSGIMDDFQEKGISTMHRSDGRITTIGPQFWADFTNHNLKKLIANYQCPILFIHGELDQTVPLVEGQELMSAAKDAHMVVIPGTNHALRPGRDDVFSAVAEFFSTNENIAQVERSISASNEK